MTDQAGAPIEPPRPIVATIVKDYLPAVGVVGLVLYGLLRLAYVFFYLRLRTTPEEVGYGYSRILSESIAGAVELILLCTAALATMTVLYYMTRLLPLVWRHGLRHSLPEAAPQFRHLSLRRVLLRSLPVAAGLVLASLPILAWWQGGLAQSGQTVRNVYFVGVPYLPVLAVQAVPADVAWIDGDSGKSLPLHGRACLMYLGQANGTAVFYDAWSRESVRLPTGSITVSLRYTFFVPDMCR